MKNYFENLNKEMKEYFSILSDEIPYFLNDYINTKEMQKQSGISVSSGDIYTKIFDVKWYSSLDHSVAVALIVWNFTKDKKQTLAGLFHDIATPAFKHCIDFMNGDYEKQESTEELTYKIISESKEIMKLLNRDNIKVEEVYDYHIYPIADNDTPRLSADRLEYTLSNGMGVLKDLWNLKEVQEIYKDIEIQINEEGIQELGFKSVKMAEKFVKGMSELSKFYNSNECKISMQFYADILKQMNKKNLITVNDLYNLSEEEVIEKIENESTEDISKYFKIFRNLTKINESDTFIEDKYCVSLNVKKRYIVPLVKNLNKSVRIDKISNIAKQDIDSYINYKTKKYAYFDF